MTPVDAPREIRGQLTPLLSGLEPGARVAVAVGSRGITGLDTLVSATIETLRSARLSPFLIPAMGSHGGATAEGQTALLAGYGVTSERLGIPIDASLDVTSIGSTPLGTLVVCSTPALRADALILINRIKPHTDFGGRLGSGLLKMLVVGLGKPTGAATFHRAGSRHGHEVVLRESASLLLRHLPLRAGIGIVEGPRHELARLVVLPPDRIEAEEPDLCAQANALMPRLPFAEIDLLIVDRMGKNLSGTGMDPAVIGRRIHGYSLAEDEPHRHPHVRRVFVRDLTPESHGNAIGIGMADFTTARLVHSIDPRATITNALTALSIQGAKIPIHFETDRDAIEAALSTLAVDDPEQARVVRIRDTLSVEHLLVSANCLEDPAAAGLLDPCGPPRPLPFNPAGLLEDFPMGLLGLDTLGRVLHKGTNSPS